MQLIGRKARLPRRATAGAHAGDRADSPHQPRRTGRPQRWPARARWKRGVQRRPGSQPRFRQLGTLEWEKRDDQGALQGAAQFAVTPNPFACRGGADPGTFADNAAPANYQKADPDTQNNIASAVGTCATKGTTAGPEVTFVNTPLSEIEIIFRSLAGEDVTKSSISCTGETPDDIAGIDPSDLDATGEDGDPDPAFDDRDEVYTDLVPGTYNCTIVIDP